MHRPLGQHFLKNAPAIKRIAEALEFRSGDVVVEIGAGHGELTEEIVRQATSDKRQGIKIIAIERDGKLVEFLKKRFADNKNIEVMSGDALEILPLLAARLPSYKLAGNIPYYITGHLLRNIGELENKPGICLFTIQSEVAKRIASEPPRMNRLAASVQFWAKPQIIMRLSKEDFNPPPKIDSAIIKLAIGPTKQKVSSSRYYHAVRALFAQPRKTILNNLATSDDPPPPMLRLAGMRQATRKPEIEDGLKKIGINPNNRPQNLSVEKIVEIAEVFGF
jgi:16S rRNA (adenine1518-N6/adenine1519-N6)-dimethyltransferase